MGSEERRNGSGESGSSEATNVVRIPRDWFGPPDELVPFGAEAFESDGGPGESVDPDAFWGEDATAIHDAVVASTGVEQPSRSSPWGSAWRWAMAAVLALVLGGSTVGWLLGNAHPRGSRSPLASADERYAPVPVRRIAKVPGATAVRHVRARFARHAKSVPSRQLTEVVYRSSQPAEASSGAASGAASSAGSAASGDSAGTNVASTGSKSSAPAFGASGVLGPMSSPDG